MVGIFVFQNKSAAKSVCGILTDYCCEKQPRGRTICFRPASLNGGSVQLQGDLWQKFLCFKKVCCESNLWCTDRRSL